jgi:cold-inducible RNA-binding protein
MKNLYVGNLPHSTTESELRTVFEAHGAVEKVSIVTDRETGRARGFGFVEMTNPAEADKAIAALNGTELGGRALKINEAQPKTDRPRSGGGGGGGRSLAAVVVAADAGATTIRDMHGSRANRAGSFSETAGRERQGCKQSPQATKNISNKNQEEL